MPLDTQCLLCFEYLNSKKLKQQRLVSLYCTTVKYLWQCYTNIDCLIHFSELWYRESIVYSVFRLSITFGVTFGETGTYSRVMDIIFFIKLFVFNPIIIVNVLEFFGTFTKVFWQQLPHIVQTSLFKNWNEFPIDLQVQAMFAHSLPNELESKHQKRLRSIVSAFLFKLFYCVSQCSYCFEQIVIGVSVHDNGSYYWYSFNLSSSYHRLPLSEHFQ